MTVNMKLYFVNSEVRVSKSAFILNVGFFDETCFVSRNEFRCFGTSGVVSLCFVPASSFCEAVRKNHVSLKGQKAAQETEGHGVDSELLGGGG
jgi:hypothetical protein